MGTNFVISDLAIVTELEKALANRIVPIGTDIAGPDINTQKTLDDAIREARADITRKLLAHVAKMDPSAVEWLACRLFKAIGYHDVQVTKRSGDSGIDVKATLVAGGVAKIRTCIQVKRQPKVGRPIVQSLRGSLGPHEVGVLLTSGHFSDDAIKEAEDKTKVPITLIDGHRLAELLLKHRIGVSHHMVTLYALQLDQLEMENLRSEVEQIREEGDADS
jgi:restriction system protein